MARTSRNGAPAASFDALDNIDIDDMFADDGDDLFDGLDIDLDQMGDITNNLESEGLDAAGTDTAAEEKKKKKTPAPAPAVEELPKRRKTKRKTKAPSHLDDSDDEPPQKKKRKSTATVKQVTKSTTKKKSTKKEETKTDTSTSKSKSKVKNSMPPPLARPPSSGPPTPSQGQVAAAGQFGGRQKRGNFSLPISRSTSEKSNKKAKTTKATASTTSDATSSEKSKGKKVATAAAAAKSSPEIPVAKAPAGFVPPAKQNNFCGLKPSNTLFYPFMPALPSEPSIKNRKQYPVIDRINSSFMSFINTSSTTKPPNGVTPAAETENIYRLMNDTLKDLNPSGGGGGGAGGGGQGSSNAPQTDKKTSVSTAIGSLRQTVSSMEKHKLAGDLFSVCALLKRQYDFLQQNLSNMERWCKENFSGADYQATYGPPESHKKQKQADSILAKCKKPLIKVKVKCNGFKAPKIGGPLFALLPPSVFGGTSPTSDKDKKTTKKRRASAADSSLAGSTSTPAAAEKEIVIKTYAELRPAKRRAIITDLVAQTAKELEISFVKNEEAKSQAIERRQNELKKMVEEDEVIVIHTAAMWQYIEKAGYFSDFTEENLQDSLRDIWAPDMKFDKVSETKQPEQALNGTTQHNKSENAPTARPSVLGGLQSLLVEEVSDEEDEDSSSEDEEEDVDESSLHDNYDEPMQPLPEGTSLPPDLKVVNLSSLSPDERAVMHLRKVGLMENQPFPIVNEVPDGLGFNSSRGLNGSAGGNEGATNGKDDGLEGIIEKMSQDLLELNIVNNARAAYLETAARSELYRIRRAKQRAEVESFLTAKCQQLQKKNKDKLKSSKPKIATKEEQVLPW